MADFNLIVPQPPSTPVMKSRGRTFRSQVPVELGDVSGLNDVVPQPPRSAPAPEAKPRPEERYNDRVGRARAANRANVMSRSGSTAEFDHYGSPAFSRSELSSRPGSAARATAPASLVASSAARMQSELLNRAMEAEVERTDCREMVRDITHAVLPSRPGSAAVRLGLGANEAYLNVPDASRHTGGAYLHSSARAGKASSTGLRLSAASVAEEQARRASAAAEARERGERACSPPPATTCSSPLSGHVTMASLEESEESGDEADDKETEPVRPAPRPRPRSNSVEEPELWPDPEDPEQWADPEALALVHTTPPKDKDKDKDTEPPSLPAALCGEPGASYEQLSGLQLVAELQRLLHSDETQPKRLLTLPKVRCAALHARCV